LLPWRSPPVDRHHGAEHRKADQKPHVGTRTNVDMRHTIASTKRQTTGSFHAISTIQIPLRDSIPIGHADERLRFSR